MNAKPHIIRKIKSIIQQYDPCAEVYLNGSRARGNVHPESD
ncbi:nucleotidyltransferase domain-containing protein [Cyclonatronum proteinivorum]